MTVLAGTVPLPVREMVCRFVASVSISVMRPLRAPTAEGVKVTLIEQLACAASELPQVLVCAKSPLATMLMMFRVVLPVLLSVTLCEELVVLIC